MKKANAKNLSILILVILYLVGAIGIGFELFKGMEGLTSLHLFISFILLVYWHENKHFSYWLWLVLAYIIGTGVEYLGVQHGFLFGQYEYGSNMEPTLWGIPLIIGINWLLLSYCFTFVLAKWFYPKIKAVILALCSAILMTAFDVIIEPVAIELDFWSWAGVSVPWTNYTGWLLVSFAINWLFLRLNVQKGSNIIAGWILALQLFFFIFVYLVRVV